MCRLLQPMTAIIQKKKISMHMIFCFASIPAKNKAHRAYDDFVNDDLHVKNRRFKFPNDHFYFKSPDEMLAYI